MATVDFITKMTDPRINPLPPKLKAVTMIDGGLLLYVNGIPCNPDVWFALDELFENAEREIEAL